jgi:hypothetical protein
MAHLTTQQFIINALKQVKMADATVMTQPPGQLTNQTQALFVRPITQSTM